MTKGASQMSFYCALSYTYICFPFQASWGLCSLSSSALTMFLERIRSKPINFDWSPNGRRFRLSGYSVKLARKFKRSFHHRLPACELSKSSIRNAGMGVFLRESATAGQILLQYGGCRISIPEADRRSALVWSWIIRNLLYKSDCCVVTRRWIRTSRQF